jgi:transcriptional regulator with XRE-family HTH domain
LRRSELATLAGISVEYLTRLEQGRDRHPSAQVLGALADALRMSTDERRLLLLATKPTDASSSWLCAQDPPAQSVRPTVQALLDQLEPAPAVLLNRLSDVLAYTDGYARLVRPAGVLDAERPNLVDFLFTDARARELYPEWERVADDWVARLRMESVPADEHVTELIDALTITGGAAFATRMAAPRTVPSRAGLELMRPPGGGEFRLNYETLKLSGGDGERIVVYLPADDETSALLDRLAGRQPGALRAVAS